MLDDIMLAISSLCEDIRLSANADENSTRADAIVKLADCFLRLHSFVPVEPVKETDTEDLA